MPVVGCQQSVGFVVARNLTLCAVPNNLPTDLKSDVAQTDGELNPVVVAEMAQRLLSGLDSVKPLSGVSGRWRD